MNVSMTSVSELTDTQLMARLREVVRRGGELMAELLAHLGEVEARRICDREAAGSLFRYCLRVLNFTEEQAFKRIGAARKAREYPLILELVARGDLHLSAVALLGPHLTAENHRALLQAAVRKSKREVEELVAQWFPRPDAPTRLRKVRETTRALVVQARSMAPEATAAGVSSTAEGSLRASSAEARSRDLGSGEAAPAFMLTTPAALPSRPADRASVSPLSPGRYRLQVTLSGATRDKLLRAQSLMRHAQPDGDLAVVLDRALSCLVDELERRQFGRLKRANERAEARDDGGEREGAPELSPGTAGQVSAAAAPDRHDRRLESPARATRRSSSATVPRAVKRAVAERDGYRCSYTAADGRRCEETAFLQYHHIHPRACGGEATVENIALRCRAHNLVEAEKDFGAAKVRGRGRLGMPESRRANASNAELPF